MRILVAGATGFIGSHLTRKLLAEGHDVIILKHSISDIQRIKDVFPKLKSYDVDRIGIEVIFENEEVDVVVHLATSYGRKGESMRDIIETNILFPSLLIDGMLKKEIRGFINTDTFFTDTYTLYSSTKKAFMRILNFFSANRDLKVINLRLEHVYGPQDSDYKFVPFLIKSILTGSPMKASEGKQRRDFVYVDDVVDAYVQALRYLSNAKENFIEFEIGTGISVSLREFAALVEEISSRRGNIAWGAIPYRENEIFDSRADITKAEKLLNWVPKHGLKEGLEKTIHWYKEDKET